MPISPQTAIRIAEERRSELGRFIQQQRKALKLSQLALGALAGIDGKTISNLENAKHDPSHETIVRLVDALGLSLADIEDYCETEFSLASKAFQVRAIILRSLLIGRLRAFDRDVRVGLAELNDKDIRRFKMSGDELDAVLTSLADDGLLSRTDDGEFRFTPAMPTGDSYLLANYAGHIRRMLDQIVRRDDLRQITIEADRIVSAPSAPARPDTFYAAVESAQLLLAADDLFTCRVTLAYADSLKLMHSWCIGGVLEENRASFHAVFAKHTIRLLQRHVRAYRIDGLGESGRRWHAAKEAADKARGSFLRAMESNIKRYAPWRTPEGYAQPGWFPGVLID